MSWENYDDYGDGGGRSGSYRNRKDSSFRRHFHRRPRGSKSDDGFGALIFLFVVVGIIVSLVEFFVTYWYMIIGVAILIFVGYKIINYVLKILHNVPMDDASRIDKIHNVFRESLEIARTSNDIEIVDLRYGVAIKSGKELLPMSSEFRREFYAIDAVKLFNAAIDRYIDAQLPSMIDSAVLLKTINNLYNIPHQSKIYAEILLERKFWDLSEQYFNRIPPNIIEALWFADGTFKNYSPDNKSQSYLEEPSLISVRYPIGTPLYPAPRINYFPTYSGLSPDERATYLKWLCNIDDEIYIGYVFIFYYGLERYLAVGNEQQFKNAFGLILRLREHHNNDSFQSYSNAALIAACARRAKRDSFERLAASYHDLSPLMLTGMAQLNLCLTADDIISLSSLVGFKNRRYIKMYPQLFKQVLSEILEERFGFVGYPMSKKHFEDCPLINAFIFANVSLERNVKIPDVIHGELFMRDLNELLVITHERVKSLLKETRKHNKHKSKEDV